MKLSSLLSTTCSLNLVLSTSVPEFSNSGPLNVKLVSLGNTTVAVSITNVGVDTLKLLRHGNILDDSPHINRFNIKASSKLNSSAPNDPMHFSSAIIKPKFRMTSNIY